MTAETAEPKQPLTADEKRAATGVLIVAVNMHRHRTSTTKRLDKERVRGDVAHLLTCLANWQEDGTRVGAAIKNVVECAIAEAATDKRLAVK